MVSPPKWDEAAEHKAWQRWYAALSPAERTPRAIYDYMAKRAKALVDAGNEYTGLRVTEEQREAQWLRDKVRRAEREVERLTGKG